MALATRWGALKMTRPKKRREGPAFTFEDYAWCRGPGVTVNRYQLPASDGNAMLALIEKMKAEGWHWCGTRDNVGFSCYFYRADNPFYRNFRADTLPEAVARAALAAYGVEVE